MGKVTPDIGSHTPGVLGTLYDITRFLFDTVTLWTPSAGSADSYGKKPVTYADSSIKCRVGYYTKTKEERLPLGYEEMDLRLIVTEPDTLPERGIILFKTEYFEILTVTSAVHDSYTVYDRGIMRKMLKRPQGINP